MGGLLLAVAAALCLLAFLLDFPLPAMNSTDPPGVRAARVVAAAAAFRTVGVLGILRALSLALASALLAVQAPALAGSRFWRGTSAVAWRLVLLSAVLFLAVDLFNAFALIPLARAATIGRPDSYAFAAATELGIVGGAVLLLSIGVLLIFMVETAGHHRRIGSGWIAFGLVAAAIGIPGGIGVILNQPKLAMLRVVAYLAFVPLLRLGIRLAAGPGSSRS